MEIKHIIGNDNVILYLLERTYKGKSSKTSHTKTFLEPADSEAKEKIGLQNPDQSCIL